MNDLEISKALALAIGWKEEQIHKNLFIDVLQVTVRDNGEWAVMQVFDYRDWAVAGPIAERYFCFPSQYVDSNGKVVAWEAGVYSEKRGRNINVVKADSPQKAIALAVIGSKKC